MHTLTNKYFNITLNDDDDDTDGNDDNNSNVGGGGDQGGADGGRYSRGLEQRVEIDSELLQE